MQQKHRCTKPRARHLRMQTHTPRRTPARTMFPAFKHFLQAVSLPIHPPSSSTRRESDRILDYFHPQNPAYLYLGCCRTDQSEIWLGMNRPKLPFQQLLHSFEFEKMPVETPEIDWIPEFQLHNFPGTTPEEQEKARRHHLDDIIHSNVASNEAIETILLVSASNRPDEPPCHIHLREEWTLSDLFDSAIDGCELRGQAPETVKSIQATFLWDDRRMQRLRKDRPDDWTIFWQALRRAWTQKRGSLTEHGCEIEMVVRVEEKGA